MMTTAIFRGTCTALVTPFDEGGGIDFAALDRLLERQLEAGVEALVIGGTTGEAATLEHTELMALIAHCVRFCRGRAKLIAGTGGNDTRRAAETARAAAALGAEALLCVTPYYNRCTQEGLLAHYEAIAAATPLPILLYNVPARTNVRIEAETCAALSKLPTVAGIKEAEPDAARVLQLHALCGPEFPVYCGCDERILPFMACGALGAVSVLSNLRPGAVKALTDAALRGEYALALRLQREQQPLMEALSAAVNPIPIKAALARAGLDCGPCRLPLTPADPELQARMEELLEAG